MDKNNNPFYNDEQKYFLNTFKRQPLKLVKAKGARVWDTQGKSYFDFFSGIAVCGVGHNQPTVVNAIKKQADLLLHSSNYFYTEPQMNLAKALTSWWAGSKVFFSNSGAEANELAIKLARLWATENKKAGRNILVFQNAFHGRTLATSAASLGPTRTHSVYAPLPAGFHAVPYNDLNAAKKALNKSFIAVLVEPVQGEGGINVATPTFLKGLAALCRKNNLLFLLDEIQTGMGRTGTFFAFEHYGVRPDVVTLAKGLAGGLPLGATLAAPRVSKLMKPGLHGSTFGGNPVACAASLEVLKLLTPHALNGIQSTAASLMKLLAPLSRLSVVKTIRGLGLMVGIELNKPGDSYVTLARERGLLINCTQGNVLRFLPPYFIQRSELKRCVDILFSVFDTLDRSDAPPSSALL